MEREYHYYDGQVVMVGDRILYCGKYLGFVEEVVMPGTQQARDCGCAEGYVSTTTSAMGSRLWTPPDGEYWEDLELVERAERAQCPLEGVNP